MILHDFVWVDFTIYKKKLLMQELHQETVVLVVISNHGRGPDSIFIHFKQCCQPLFLKILIAKAKRGNADLNILFKHN